jgi:hypothetical protein
MPNYVSHLVKVSGKPANVEQFRTAIRKKDARIDDESAVIDFNRFIKMPEQLLKTTSPSITSRVEMERKLNPKFSIETDTISNLSGVKLKAALAQEEELRNKFGYDNWYDWSKANWGTKWNACDPSIIGTSEEPGGIVTFMFTFQTAWTMPEGIINSMVSMCKSMKVSVEIQSEEEGSFFDCLVTITPNSYEVNIGEPFYYLEDNNGNLVKVNDVDDDELKQLGLDPDDITGSQRGFVCDNTGDLFIDFKRSNKKVYAAGEEA